MQNDGNRQQKIVLPPTAINGSKDVIVLIMMAYIPKSIKDSQPVIPLYDFICPLKTRQAIRITT
jgi:hypothetical protein